MLIPAYHPIQWVNHCHWPSRFRIWQWLSVGKSYLKQLALPLLIEQLPGCSFAGRVPLVGPVTSHHFTGHVRSQCWNNSGRMLENRLHVTPALGSCSVVLQPHWAHRILNLPSEDSDPWKGFLQTLWLCGFPWNRIPDSVDSWEAQITGGTHPSLVWASYLISLSLSLFIC